jgi:Tol biopolymer transport system component
MTHLAPTAALSLALLLGLSPAPRAQLVPGGPGVGVARVAVSSREAPGPAVLRVNLGQGSQEAEGTTDASALSDDGQWVAFSSVAANLVARSDGAGLRDVFLRNIATGEVQLASRNAAGLPGDGASGSAVDVSADGRFVAFDSWASDLVPGDVVGTLDVFVFDRLSGAVSRVSVSTAGVPGNAASAEVRLASDGSRVTFSSWADNLVPGDSNGLQDVFVHELASGTTWRVSEDAAGVGGIGASHSPEISATGQFIAYASRANNLVAEPLSVYHYIFVHDALSGETWHASKDSFGEFGHGDSDTRPSITPDGRFVAFASQAYNLALPEADLNWESDVFVHDHLTGLTRRVSVHSGGGEGSGGSIQPSISADGRFVAFTSGAPDLVDDDQNAVLDVFVHDLLTGETRCVSRALHDGVANASSDAPHLSVDGAWLVFGSEATDLITVDGNQARDVFLCAVP